MIRFGKVKFIQIDAGIAGGIIAGKEIDIEAPEKFNVLHNYKLKIGVNCESQH